MVLAVERLRSNPKTSTKGHLPLQRQHVLSSLTCCMLLRLVCLFYSVLTAHLPLVAGALLSYTESVCAIYSRQRPPPSLVTNVRFAHEFAPPPDRAAPW